MSFHRIEINLRFALVPGPFPAHREIADNTTAVRALPVNNSWCETDCLARSGLDRLSTSGSLRRFWFDILVTSQGREDKDARTVIKEHCGKG